MCDIPHVARNFASFEDVNLGFLSDDSKSGTVVQQNLSLNSAMTFGAVVSLPMSMTSGQFVLQLTMMRSCRLPCEPKSTVICWNGLFGIGLLMNGSLVLDGKWSWQWQHLWTKCSISLSVDCEASSNLGACDALVCLVETTQHGSAKAWRNEWTAATHNEVILDNKALKNAQVEMNFRSETCWAWPSLVDWIILSVLSKLL